MEPRDSAYYLVLFKIEGHGRWRAHLSSSPSGFEVEVEKNWTRNPKQGAPKVTERKVIRIDRKSGEVEVSD